PVRPHPLVEIDGECELSGSRDGKSTRMRNAVRPRLGAVRPCGEDLARVAAPGRAVKDRVTVRREARVVNRSSLERQALKCDRRRSCPAPAGQIGQRKKSRSSPDSRGPSEPKGTDWTTDPGGRTGDLGY